MKFPKMLTTNVTKKAGYVGQMAIKPTLAVNKPTPRSIPALRPRLSATDARNGLRIPEAERNVSPIDSKLKSTPKPRLKMGRNGYTMRIMVFIEVRVAIRAGSSTERVRFNAACLWMLMSSFCHDAIHLQDIPVDATNERFARQPTGPAQIVRRNRAECAAHSSSGSVKGGA